MTERARTANLVLASARLSATDPCLKARGIPIPLHRDLGKGAINVAQLIGCQLNGGRSDVLLQAMQLGGPRDRHDPRLPGQQPGERELGTRHLLPVRDFAEKINQGLVRCPGLWREARDDVAEILAVERRALADRAREEALAEWEEGHEADPELLQGRQDLLLGFTPPQ